MLLAAGLYEPAVKELEFARAKWGDSPGITATIAWANKQMAAAESGTEPVRPRARLDHADEAGVSAVHGCAAATSCRERS